MRYEILKKFVLMGDILAGICVSLMVILITAEVIIRTFFGGSLMVVDEYCGYLMSVSVYFGAIQSYHSGGFVQIKILYDRFGDNVKKALDLVFDATFLIFNSYVTWYFFYMLQGVIRYKSTSSFISQTPLVFPMGAVMAGMVLFEITLIIEVILSIVHYKNPPPIITGTVSEGGTH